MIQLDKNTESPLTAHVHFPLDGIWRFNDGLPKDGTTVQVKSRLPGKILQSKIRYDYRMHYDNYVNTLLLIT